MKQLFLTIFLTMLAIPMIGQKEIQIHQWETYDLSFQSTNASSTPFQEVIGCVFRAEGGREISVPGFYNGGNEWIVRFTPPESGLWKSTSYSSLADISGIRQKIRVGEPKQHSFGGIRISSEDRKHLVFDSGKPYHLLAYEADWLFALDYGNPDLPKTKQLLSHIQANGFNHIVMNVYAFDVSWKKDANLKAEHEYGGKLNIFPFGGTNEQPDHSTLNVEFFQHLDRLITLLDEYDQVAHLMIYVWNKMVNWPPANSPEDNLYFDYVIKRYQAYNNIIWDISKEALGYGRDDINYISERIGRLRRLDAYQRLVTVHDFSYCASHPEKVDLISVQSWASNLYDQMLSISQRFPDKPVLNIEHGGYERSPYDVYLGNYNDPAICLSRNYLCAFAGIYSTYYWQGSSWNVIIHDPFNPTFDPHPKFSYYKHFQKFLTENQFDQLQPISNRSASGMCLNDADGTFIYFVPKDNVAIDIKNLPQCQSLHIRWFNPLTGEYSDHFQREWSGYFRLRPAFEGIDNILLIHSQE